MKILAIVLLTLSSMFLLTQNIIAEEVHGQVLYRDGGPASYVQIHVDGQRQEAWSTNRFGFYSIHVGPGEHTIAVNEIEKTIYVSPGRATKVDFRVSR